MALQVGNCFFLYLQIKLVIIKGKGVRIGVSIPGSLSFAKFVMMSSARDARYASQNPFIR